MRLFTLLFLFIGFTSYAQSFEFVDTSLTKEVTPDDFENYIENHVKNISESTKVLRWTQIRVFYGSKWSPSQICDNNLCYTPSVMTKTISVAPGATSLMKILFQPNGQDTSGYYIVTAQVDGSETIESEGHYYFEGATVSAKKIEHVESVKFYPNPAVDVVYYSSPLAINEIKIYNSAGGLVLVNRKPENNQLNINELPGGTYFAFFTFENKTLGVSKLIKN